MSAPKSPVSTAKGREHTCTGQREHRDSRERRAESIVQRTKDSGQRAESTRRREAQEARSTGEEKHRRRGAQEAKSTGGEREERQRER